MKLKKLLENITKRSFDDNLELLRKFESEDKSYSEEARDILQDADELSDDELDEIVTDFMEQWKLNDPRKDTSKTDIKRGPNPWDQDYRDGDYS